MQKSKTDYKKLQQTTEIFLFLTIDYGSLLYSPVNIQRLMKMIEQYDVVRTHSCKPGYLNLSIASWQMYNSIILEQKRNDIPDHNDQNAFETSFASVFS